MNLFYGQIEWIINFLTFVGTIYILKGDIENAEKELTKIAKLQECDKKIKVNTLIKLGTIKIQDISSKDSIDDALKWFDEAIKIDNENPDVYLHRAQVNKSINKFFILIRK